MRTSVIGRATDKYLLVCLLGSISITMVLDEVGYVDVEDDDDDADVDVVVVFRVVDGFVGMGGLFVIDCLVGPLPVLTVPTDVASSNSDVIISVPVDSSLPLGVLLIMALSDNVVPTCGDVLSSCGDEAVVPTSSNESENILRKMSRMSNLIIIY